MKAVVFPGQGAQFVGMGKDLYENNPLAKELFDKADEILGYKITDIMFAGTDEELKQTKVTQPAVFLHSVIKALCTPELVPDMVGGIFCFSGCRRVKLRRRFEVSVCSCHGDAESLRDEAFYDGSGDCIARRTNRGYLC